MPSPLSLANVQTLPSVDIVQDTEVLVHALNGRLRVEESSKDYAVLVRSTFGDENQDRGDISVLLVLRQIACDTSDPATATRSFNTTLTTWIVDEALIEEVVGNSNTSNGAVVKRVTIDGTVIARLHMSTCIVLLMPPKLVDSPSGRKTVAEMLHQIGKGGGSEALDDLPNSAEPATSAETCRATAPSPAKSSTGVQSPTKPGGGGITANDRCLPRFPNLEAKLMQQNGNYEDFQINTTEAQEFETELFKGKVLILLKPAKPEDDPYWTEKIFSKKQRRIVVQVQGKFKKQPQGTVYLGGETPQPLQIGLLSRGVVGILLRFIESLAPSVVYSYGDKKDQSENLPRIVFPAHMAFERIQITPPGQEPPPITHEPFLEPDEDRKQRLKGKNWKWNTSDTYSLTFYTMYFNFAEWKVASVPVASGMSFSKFWGDSPLRLVVYENEGNKKNEHLQKENRYHFAFQMKYLGGTAAEDDEVEEIPGDKTSEKPVTLTRSTSHEEEGLISEEMMLYVPEPLAEEPLSDEEEFYDAKPSQDFLVEAEDLLESISVSSVSLDPSTEINLALINAKTPAWIEMAGNGVMGGYSKFYAINVGNDSQSKTILRLKADCENFLDKSGLRSRAAKFVAGSFSPRLSISEKRRRMLGYVVSKQSVSALQNAFDSYVPGDTLFLKRPKPEQNISDVILSGYVARAVSDRHWVEEWATLEGRGMITFQRTDKKLRSFRVRTSSILAVKILNDQDCPVFFGYYFLCIESIGRSIYLMFSNSSQRDTWHSTISEQIGTGNGDSDYQLSSVDRPAQEYMHNSSVWEMKKRRIYNCAVFSFHAEGEMKTTTLNDPLALVSRTLQLAAESVNDDESALKRHEFLQCVSTLKLVDLNPLTEDERLAFYLNLYHTMVLHAFLILGPPSAGLSFITLFKDVSYEVGDDLMSLAELEHCIIRAKMAQPSNFLSRFVLPRSTYRLALGSSDFRIIFALNSGSTSSPEKVLLFTPNRLQEQLDTATRLVCMESVTVTKQGVREVVLTLPRVCQWYGQDFGSQANMVNNLAPYLKAVDRDKLLATCWSSRKNAYDMSCITIKYDDFSFVCRPLSILPQETT